MKTYEAIIEIINNSTPTNHMKKLAKNNVFVFGENHMKKLAKNNVFVFGEDVTAPQFFFLRLRRRQNSDPIFFLSLTRRQNGAPTFCYAYGEDEKMDPLFFSANLTPQQ